jgi:hypothetical protein
MARALLLRDSATAASSKRRESCRSYSVIGVTPVLHLHVTGRQSIFNMARCDFCARQKAETDAAYLIETSLKELCEFRSGEACASRTTGAMGRPKNL